MRDDNGTEPQSERRQHQRFSLPQPLRTSIAGTPGHVIDASIGGVGVVHYERALPCGAACRIHFYSKIGPITMDCEVARTGPNQNLSPTNEDGAWRTGLKIVSIDSASAARLRRLTMTLAEA